MQLLTKEEIETIESFSKKFGSIIELENKNEEDPFKKVYDIIQDGSLLFDLDNEDFGYTKNKKFIKIKSIEELVKYKNKINIQKKKKIKKYDNKNNEKNQISKSKDDEEEKTEKDIFEEKCDKLLFFKDIISNLEIIYDKINILRKKGFNIPILIKVSIQYPKISYELNGQEKELDKIKDYLFKVKNDYEEQLNEIYENEKYLRILYGKSFRKVKQHQGGSYGISEMIRYILNKTSNKDKIQDGDLYNESLGEDFEDEYKDYTKKTFEQISKYLISLFKKNDSNFQKHYDSMKIKEEYNNKFKGIYIEKCEKISMEEYILGLFLKKLDKLPIAQNLLICSNETSIEEIQSFLYRAILCEFNTLFAIEILESFTNFQHNKMYSYIDRLLSIKLEKYKKQNEKKKGLDKSKSRDYLDSYIVFVYQKLDNENAFKNELEKYTRKNQKNVEEERRGVEDVSVEEGAEKSLEDMNLSEIESDSVEDNIDESKNKIIIPSNFDIANNIKVISSDVCGLGKSFRIKKMISEEKKIYYHFPLGGKLTKD